MHINAHNACLGTHTCTHGHKHTLLLTIFMEGESLGHRVQVYSDLMDVDNIIVDWIEMTTKSIGRLKHGLSLKAQQTPVLSYECSMVFTSGFTLHLHE